MKDSKVVKPCQLLEIHQHCQATESANVLTGDESWFVLDHPHHGVWAASRDDAPEKLMTNIEAQKSMI
jgi:hypothetical protein